VIYESCCLPQSQGFERNSQARFWYKGLKNT